jgi:hypothetical protein
MKTEMWVKEGRMKPLDGGMKPLDWAGKEPSVFPPFPLFLARIIK